MFPAIRDFLNKSPVAHVLRALAHGAWICSLAWVAPATGQTAWRTVSAVPLPTPPVVMDTRAPAVEVPKADAGRLGEGGLQMFGVRLSTATRDVMRQALRIEGLMAQREDEAFSEDIYNAPNLMPGLQQLKFSYSQEGQRLAKVEYVFMTFADNAHVEDVKLRIESRFGRPARVVGREESGPYQAAWRLPDQMEILVGREWPSKTTYLRFFNVPIWGQVTDLARETVQSRREKDQNPQALPVWVAR